MKIAVTTPTGRVGGKTVDILLDRGNELVLYARDGSRLAREKERGATVVEGDLADSEGLRRFTSGADALLAVLPIDVKSRNLRSWHRRVARALGDAILFRRLRHVVLLSCEGAHLDRGNGLISGLHDAEKRIEDALDSHASLTILRPAFFMENYLEHAEAIRRSGEVRLPLAADRSVPMIAADDVADVAADRLGESPAPGTRILPLHGPRDYSFAQAAEAIGRELGRKVRHVEVGADEARAALEARGASRNVGDGLLELAAWLNAAAAFERTDASTTPTTVEEFARGVLAPALR